MTAAAGARRAAVLAALACGPAATAHAGGGAATDAYADVAPGIVDAHALVDVYLLHDVQAPSADTTLREFDRRSDRPSLEYVRLTLAHRPAPLGVRVDVGAGDTADVFRLEDPANARHPTQARAWSYFGQAFATVVIPVGRGLAVDVGKFATPAGFEDNESIANWSYSRSFLFSWAEPSLHTGVRASLAVTSAVGVSLFWLNGWNTNFVDGNDLRSFAVAVSGAPRASVALAVAYVGGLERAPTALGDPRLGWRDLVTASCAWTPRPWLALALAADYGDGRGNGAPAVGGVAPVIGAVAPVVAGAARFGGVAGYARLAPWPWLAATVRAEYYADPNGFTTGTAQSLGEVTATLELRRRRAAAELIVRAEYRHDQSSARPFPAATGSSASQDTLTLALIAAVARATGTGPRR